MPLFSIPDIRLFWSSDSRFTSQFRAPVAGEAKEILKPQQFKPFSKCVMASCDATLKRVQTLCSVAIFNILSMYPPCTKDVAFWLPQQVVFHENNLHEAVRQVTLKVALTNCDV